MRITHWLDQSLKEWCKEIVENINKDFPKTAKIISEDEKVAVEVNDEWYNQRTIRGKDEIK